MVAKNAKIVVGLKNLNDKDLIIRALEGFEIITLLEDNYKFADLILIDTYYARNFGRQIIDFKNQQEIFLPVVVVLEKTNKIEPWLSAGFDDYLKKPFTKLELESKLKILFKLRENVIKLKQSSEARYEAIFQATGTATLIVDANNVILLANNECFPITGYKPSELIGTLWTNYASPESLRLMQYYHDLRRSDPDKVPNKYEVKLIHKNAGIRDVILFVNMIPGTEQSVVSMLDITEQRNAEKALAKSLYRYKNLTDISPVGVFYTDANGSTTYVNEKWCEICGLTYQEALGYGWLKTVHPEDRELLIEGWGKDLKSGVPSFAEYRLLRSDGTIRWVIGRATPEMDAENKIVGYIGTITDITERKLNEELINEKQRQLSTLISNLKGMVYHSLNDQNWTMKFVSNGCFELTGYLPEELIDNSVVSYNNLILPEDRDFVWSSVQRACENKTPYEIEYRIVTKNGNIKYVWEKGVAIYSQDGSIDHLEGFITDITEKKLFEAKLYLQTAALEASANAIVIANREGFIVWANAAFTRLTGYKVPDEVFGRNPRDLVKSGKQDKRFYENFWNTILSGKVWHGELINRRKDGSLYDEEMTITPVKDGQGKITHFIAVKQDITERKWQERELQREKDFVQIIAQTSPVGIARVDKNGNIIYTNTRAEEILRLTKSKIIGQKYNSPEFKISDFDGDKFPDEELPFSKVKKELKAFTDIRHAINRPDGNRILLSINAAPVFDELGEFDGMVASFEDITDRIKSEQAIKEREQWFRRLADTTTTAIVIYQGERFVYVNKAAEKFTGYTAEELFTMYFWDVAHPDYRELVRERGLSRQLGAQNIPDRYEIKIVRKDGTVRWIDYSAGTIDWFGQPAAIGTAVDITERKKTELELQKSLEKYEQFFMNDLTGDYISTVEGKIVACNPAFLKIFGFSSIEEAMAVDTSVLYDSPDDRIRLLSRLQRERKIEYYELKMRKIDGTPLYIVANVIGIFDEDDRLIQMQGYLFDDTKRQSLENMLQQAQKLESLGTLASGIAHDFNNILAIILGHASLLRLSSKNPEKISQSVDAITLATERGANLVKQMLTFARKTEISLQPLEINTLIKEIGKMIKETFPKIIEVNLNLKPNLPPVLADITQIHQVLLNLCVNARDAMPNGGKITITTELMSYGKLKEYFSQVEDSKYVAIIVSDTGIGMSEEIKKRIFEPFFTTKSKGQGTGLGLSVVHGIVSAHKGFIRVESEPGQGATFYIYLPSVEQYQSKIGTAVLNGEDLKGGTETILIIEDELYLKQMLTELLCAKGYNVLSAENGEEGVEMYKQNASKVELVITDMGLPKLDGKDVFYQIKKINPSVKVIIASGYIEPTLKSQLFTDGVKDFISKPYSLGEILRKVREVLNFK